MGKKKAPSPGATNTSAQEKKNNEAASSDTLAAIYKKDAATDKKDIAYEASVLDALQRKEEAPLSMRDKVEGTKAFARMLTEPNNHQTAKVFLLTSFILFTLPFIVFFISVFFIEPAVGSSDPDTFNAMSAIITTTSVVIAYIVYAFKTDALGGELDYPNLSGIQPKKTGQNAAQQQKKTKKD